MPATIHGYADRLSVAPGEPIEFKVSTDTQGSYRADVVRLIHGDTNPAGPGFKERVVDSPANGEYDGRQQAIRSGSHVTVVDRAGHLALRGAISMHVFAQPTTPGKRVCSACSAAWRPRVGPGMRSTSPTGVCG